MAQYQDSGAVASHELHGELESINELLESVDDDIAAILAEIADEEAESGHIPVLDDVVGNELPTGVGDTLDAHLQATRTSQPSDGGQGQVTENRAARAVISAVYREEQPRKYEDDLTDEPHSAVTFSRDDFVSVTDDSANDAAAPPKAGAAPRSVDPLDAWLDCRRPTPNPVPEPETAPARRRVEDRPAASIDPEVLAECTAEVVAGIVEEWLPVLREELSRRLGEAVSKAVATQRR